MDTLQPIYCNNSMTKIYNFINNRKIDISDLPHTLYPNLPSKQTWGIVDIVGETGSLVIRDLVYYDVSNDNFYKYIITISIVNKEIPQSCNSNPLTSCMCVYTDAIDNDGNVSYDIPTEIIDSALDKLPIVMISPLPSESNSGKYLILGIVGLGIIYYAYKNKILKTQGIKEEILQT